MSSSVHPGSDPHPGRPNPSSSSSSSSSFSEKGSKRSQTNGDMQQDKQLTRAAATLILTARVFTAVDGGPLFARRPSTALPLQATRGRLWSNQHGLLVERQMTRGLAVGVFAEAVGVVVEVGHVAVVSGLGGHGLKRYEPAVGEGPRGGVMREAVLIHVGRIGIRSPSRTLVFITAGVQLRRRGSGRGQELRHEAAAVHLHVLWSRWVLEHVHLLVRRVRVQLREPLRLAAVQRRVEVGRRAAPIGQQELDVPGGLAVVVQELLRHRGGDLQLPGTAGGRLVAERVWEERVGLGLPHLDGVGG
ncbi:hypothetical protein EYF80_031798 [Liparis tanakae]|uniref:Uncharacterized protein n=1 Tax=Liparis tanakae TaxID=230148 RepID=A0A4Z2GZE9_9TELE|nr:hypothetical protein EYF80_031798 [Liparis tanakae]